MKIIGKPKIGLALGGGGARGLAHIGVIKVLEREKIPIDYIAGTSAGALIGGIYAATKNIKKIEEISQKLNYRDFIRTFSDITLKSGLVKGRNAIKFIEKYTGKITFEQMKIPFRAVTTDLVTGKTYMLYKGNVAKAIRTSCSIPGLFKPLKYGNKILIDGGVTEQVPVKSVKMMGAEKTIAVNLNRKHFPPKFKDKSNGKISPIANLMSAINIMIYNVAKQNVKTADIILAPEIPDIPLTKFVNGAEYIKIGEKECEKHIDKIKWMSKRRFLLMPVS